MDKKEFLEIMKQLKMAYPTVFEKMTTEKITALYGVWYGLLKDVDKDELMEAVNEHIKTNKFFPTIAELRERAASEKRISNREAFQRITQYYPVQDGSVVKEAYRVFLERMAGIPVEERETAAKGAEKAIKAYVTAVEEGHCIGIIPLDDFLRRFWT